jgi:hypothetical protein
MKKPAYHKVLLGALNPEIKSGEVLASTSRLTRRRVSAVARLDRSVILQVGQVPLAVVSDKFVLVYEQWPDPNNFIYHVYSALLVILFSKGYIRTKLDPDKRLSIYTVQESTSV